MGAFDISRIVSLVKAAPREAARVRATGTRAWARAGRAHIEARGVHHVDAPDGYVDALKRELTALDGVCWVAVNRVLGDVVLDFAPERVSLDQLRRTVRQIEHEYGVAELARDRPAHPGDAEPVLDSLVGLVGDLLGAAVGLTGRSMGRKALPAEAMALPAVLEFLPEVVRKLESRFGAPRVAVALSMATSLLGAATQSPASALTDAFLRSIELRDALARRRVWENLALSWVTDADHAGADVVPLPDERPAALPSGPVERLAHIAGVAVGLVSTATLPGGGWLEAARTIAVTAPKATHMGSTAFAAELGRILSGRGALVRDPVALRRLDRIDTVVIDADVLTTGRLVIADVVTVTEGDGAEKDAARKEQEGVRQRVAALFDPQRCDEVVRSGRFRLGPLALLGVAVPPHLAARRQEGQHQAEVLLGLVTGHDLVAVVMLEKELDPLAEAIVAAAHHVGRVVVSPVRSRLAQRVGADAAVAGGSRLTSSVRSLQGEGATVALIARGHDAALAAADCGIGLLSPGRRPPWSADVLCEPTVDIWFLLQAIVVARSAGARNVQLAVLGAITGAVVGLVSPAPEAARRGTLPGNAAACISMAAALWSAQRLAGRSAPVSVERTPWHALSVEQTLDRLRTTSSGLSGEEVHRRQAYDGDDVHEEPENLLSAAVSELDNPLTAPLAAGAGISAATGSVVDAALVAAVMAGNALLGAAQRVTANRAVRRLASAAALRATTVRAGEQQNTPASDLVPGDIVAVAAGDAVPADCRLIDADHLEMDESSLTGESLPVTKNPEASLASTVADRASMLYAGTTVAAGTGLAVVTATGRETEAERSAATVDGEAPSGVEARLKRLTSASLPVAVAGAGAVLAAGMLRGQARQSLDAAVALAVAAVPEGLPFAATVAQLAAARRLTARNVFVRTPRTLEALGRVNVVCFDKTGTLTEGQIELRLVSDASSSDASSTESIDGLTGARRTVLAAALRASPVRHGDAVSPHPTDRAVEAAGSAAGVTSVDGMKGWRPQQELPFEPGRGFHAVLGHADEGNVISVKGASEIVLPRCVTHRVEGGSQPITSAYRERLEHEVERLARSGYRVLVVAERYASRQRGLDDDRVERLELLGMLGLADPVRSTAAQAIRNLRQAGVDVVMLTGDHPSTAAAIAAELDLLDSRGTMTGAELANLGPDALAEAARSTAVFARVSPGHKVAIVRALQQAGRIVAVTGDGANDAPAIQLANVGIALGQHSTAAARQAADIVIADDHIETIVDAVIESRAMWRSVRDSVGLLLGGNLGEIGFTVTSSLLSAQPPLRARQLLLVNLLTDLAPALVVAMRPPRGVTLDSLLREGPDAAVGDELTRDIVIRAVATASATTGAWLVARATGTNGRASTVALAALVCTQLAQTAASSGGDPVVLAAVAASAAVLAALVQFPVTSAFFGSRPIGPVGWGVVLSAAIVSSAAGYVAQKYDDKSNSRKDDEAAAGPATP